MQNNLYIQLYCDFKELALMLKSYCPDISEENLNSEFPESLNWLFNPSFGFFSVKDGSIHLNSSLEKVITVADKKVGLRLGFIPKKDHPFDFVLGISALRDNSLFNTRDSLLEFPLHGINDIMRKQIKRGWFRNTLPFAKYIDGRKRVESELESKGFKSLTTMDEERGECDNYWSFRHQLGQVNIHFQDSESLALRTGILEFYNWHGLPML